MTNSYAHTCGIDCKLEISEDGKSRAHVMYPSDPNGAAGRYQAAQNLTMTRREYRATGQDETREVRLWTAERNARRSLDGFHVSPRRNYRRNELVKLLSGA